MQCIALESSRAAALVLARCSMFVRAYTPLTESEEKQRLLAIYKFSDHVTKENEAQGSRYR